MVFVSILFQSGNRMNGKATACCLLPNGRDNNDETPEPRKITGESTSLTINDLDEGFAK